MSNDLPMSFCEYAKYDALDLAKLVRDKEVTAEELAQMAAAAVEKLNPQLNAVIEVWQDRVTACDKEADVGGPFGGVPLFLKDLGAAEKGRLQEMGCRMFKGNVSPHTTELVKKFKKAGLNLMGRTTCPDNAYTFASESELNGQTHNPWHLEYISGGSSSGSAAIVAAGVVPIAHANDGGGSTRIPASICGLVGLKPSRGRLSMAPWANEAIIPEGAEGVLTRTVRDTAVLFDHISGSDIGEFMHAAPPRRPYAEELKKPRKYSIAVSTEPWGRYNAAPHIIDEVVKTVELLESLGHTVVHDTPRLNFEEFYKWFTVHWIGGTLALQKIADEMGVQLSPDHLEYVLYDMVVQAREISLEQWFHKDDVLMQVNRDLDTFFRENCYDLVLTPTMAIDTPSLGSEYRLHQEDLTAEEFCEHGWQAIPYTPLCNCAGLPAISLPLAQDARGLPLGMHFFGRWGSEDKLINLAAQVEEAQPWIERTPSVHVSM